jgi:RHS repeat-associated protein
MLDGVGLIHMAGRVYDPTVGRFLSVDPLVRDAAASQSWNGYGYVEGRVLSATDPSGWQTVDCPQCVRYRADPPRSAMEVVVVTARRWDPLSINLDRLGLLDLSRGLSRAEMPSQTAKEGGKEEPHTQTPGTCPNTAGNAAMQFANNTASTVLGMADGLTFGQYGRATESFGLGPVAQNGAYNAGLYGSAAFSGARLLYAGASSAIRIVPGISAAEAVATRNALKGVFSTLGADHPRAYTVSQMMSKYGSEAAVVKAASRTDSTLNAAAAALATSSAAQLATSGCP